MASKLNNVISEFAGDISAHGIGRIQSSKPLTLKVLWACIFVGSTGVLIWQLYGLIYLYYQHPVTVKVSGVYQSVTFPALTFCNLNPIRASQLSLAGSELSDTISEYAAAQDSEITGNLNSNNTGAARKKRDISNPLPQQIEKTYDKVLDDFDDNRKVKSVEKYQTAIDSEGNDMEHSMNDELLHIEDYQNGMEEYWVYADSMAMDRDVRSANNDSYTEPRFTFDTEMFNTELPNDVTARQETTMVEETTATITTASTIALTPSTTAATTNTTTTAATTNMTSPSTIFTTGATTNRTTNAVTTNMTSPSTTLTTAATTNTTTTVATTNMTSSSTATPTAVTSSPATTTSVPSPNEVQYDVADDYYVPAVNLSDVPWFEDTQGATSAQATNTIKLASVLSTTPIQTKRDIGYQIEDLLQECTWNGVVCTPLNFTGFYDKTYGNCFTFNSGFNGTEVLKAVKPGSVYGLTITLFIDQSEYIDTLASSAGVRLLIHSQAEQPFPVDNGFTAIPGQKTSIQIINRQFNLLAEPYGPCTEIGQTSEVLLYNKGYSQLACTKSCYQHRTMLFCDCADPELTVPMDAVVCTANATGCITEVKERIASGELTCDCPVSCVDSLYTTAISTSTWPGDNFIERVQNVFSQRTDIVGNAVDNASMISKNFLRVEVFFNELKYEETVESPEYLVPNLLSDIGGQLGLWLGFSMLTVIEFGQFFIELATFPCRKKDSDDNSEDKTVKDDDGN